MADDQPEHNCEVCLSSDADGRMTLTVHYFPDPPLDAESHEREHKKLWDMAMGVLMARGIPEDQCRVQIKRNEHPNTQPARQSDKQQPQKKAREQEH